MKNTTSVASVHRMGVSAEELGVVAMGWSIKKDVLGKKVFNDNNDDIGTIEDMLVTRDQDISYAIIGAGGFLGLGRHDVAVPVYQLRMDQSQIRFPGATAEKLKSMPEFKYK